MKFNKLPVEALLKSKGLKYDLINLSRAAYTVDDVIKYSNGGVISEEICKTIILKGKKSKKGYAMLLRGGDKLDFTKISAALGEKLTIASPDEVKESAGIVPGAVCPFLLNVPLFVDKKVLELKKANFGSGDHLFGLNVFINDLDKAVEYSAGDFLV